VALVATTHLAGLIAILAAARSGRPIVILNATDPVAHQETVAHDAAVAAWLRETDPGAAELTVLLREDGQHEPDPMLADAAYVLYTSGSTGRPKGVVVPHTALTERMRGLAELPGLRAGESMLAMSSLSFDMALDELLLPLIVGGTVLAGPSEVRLDPDSFATFVDRWRPDVVQATPSFYRLAMASGWTGLPAGQLWSGGEALTPSLARQLLPHCAALWNLYGPTEATICVTGERVATAERVGLGRPLPGSGLFLRDFATGELADDGEIVVYGALARGYLNAPEETSRRFVRLQTPDGPRDCYRTGDRARLHPDGWLEFLGRLDGQVKLRGHRIELTGVEATLEEHPDVAQAAVVLCDADRPSHSRLAAFVVTTMPVSERELRSWLLARLPAAAVPARITAVAALPRTTAGKVDRVRLVTEATGRR